MDLSTARDASSNGSRRAGDYWITVVFDDEAYIEQVASPVTTQSNHVYRMRSTAAVLHLT